MISTKNIAQGKRALIVLGMHRSGTSAMTGVLNCLGVQLGSNLYTGHQGINDKGYFEHNDIADLDDEVLIALDSCWDDILPWKDSNPWENRVLEKYSKRLAHYIRRDFAKADVWAVKDPRVCRLLPWWQGVLQNLGIEAYYLLVLRRPLEVADSLQRRDGFSLEKSLLLWAEHNLQAEFWTRKAPRTVVLFDRLLAEPERELERIETALNLHFPVSPCKATHFIHEFLSIDLRHQKARIFLGESTIEQIVNEAFTVLSTITVQDQLDCSIRQLDGLRQTLDRYRADFPQLMVEQIRMINHYRTEYNLVWLRTCRSWSWLIGKPIRVIERFVGRDV